MRLGFTILILFIAQLCFSQARPLATTPIIDSTSNDSLVIKIDEFADEKNGLRSLVVPGWGQMRNKQPAKAALFFGAVAGGVYSTINYRKDFVDYNDAYKLRLQTFDDPQDNYTNLSLNELWDERQAARNKKDIVTGATAYVYVMNAFDAAAQYKIMREDVDHSPTKAAYYSALLPGLGQAYNKKYWKIPIVYAALGTSAYFAINNRNYHRNYQKELEYRSVGESTGFRGALPDNKIEEGQEYWRKWRDFAYIATGGVYLLNILDATVDAHLVDFNVDDDLAIQPSPSITEVNGNLVYGVTLSVNLDGLKKKAN